MRRLLSYPFSQKTPTYRFSPPIVMYGVRLIERGDLFNSYRLEMWNHHGTHIDGPNHADDSWKKLHEFPIDSFFFERPALIDIPMGDSELASLEEMQAKTSHLVDPDVILIRSGWTAIRQSDPQRYTSSNPGIGPAATRYLLERFPNLRAIGFDNVSLGAMRRYDENHETHRIWLNPNEPRRDRMIIEDLNLPPDLPPPKSLSAIPLFVEGIDSCWATVIAEV